MKGPSFYFQKMSLTRQILTIILTVLMFFIMFFFVFVSDNIDRTITKQMYELILNRQTPIVGLVDSKQTDSIDEIYAFLASDSVQTNCIIQDGKIILKIVCAFPHPSISAASSSAIGTVSKKLLIINVHSGITKVVYARIRQR